ncbi:MAG: DUF465 domain-containing protein [Paracoccus denitrificans]|uniref:DUF465 domain-containing protein n=1 Tax=Paracoccus denitrificans TaxID=266 RepID=A0A533ICM6_PARDE|nr:MAG: DUF465 domain-containing protein [Paracoccus denitrificans]
MMAAPHAIHEEFPDDADIIHELKLSDAHFAKLLDDYDSLNDEVAAAETFVKPTDQDHETEIRRRRVLLKDQIAQAIAAAKA